MTLEYKFKLSQNPQLFIEEDVEIKINQKTKKIKAKLMKCHRNVYAKEKIKL